jgi:hypothetical protein
MANWTAMRTWLQRKIGIHYTDFKPRADVFALALDGLYSSRTIDADCLLYIGLV